jgi:Protein of unknown function (DUF2905)
MVAMNFGRLLIIAGAFLIVMGVLIALGDKLPLRIGRLPGDIYVRGKHTSFYFPIVSCILFSLVLSFVFWLFRR